MTTNIARKYKYRIKPLLRHGRLIPYIMSVCITVLNLSSRSMEILINDHNKNVKHICAILPWQ